MRWIPIVILLVGLTGSAAQAQQKPESQAVQQKVQLGPGMGLIAPGLIQIVIQTNFFLMLAERIEMNNQQRATIEGIIYEFQKEAVLKQADLNVARAELARLLSREDIDLQQVRAKIEETAAIDADIQMLEIQSLLKAIQALTHEQHLRIVSLVREL